MPELTMCGYRCDLCKAFTPNIKKIDKREMLSAMWSKYYGGLNILASDIYCDGYRCNKPGAKRIDMECLVRKCGIEKGLNHCGDCENYSCETFDQREGLCQDEAKSQQGEKFDIDEYNKYLLAYDNRTRIDEYTKSKRTL